MPTGVAGNFARTSWATTPSNKVVRGKRILVSQSGDGDDVSATGVLRLGHLAISPSVIFSHKCSSHSGSEAYGGTLTAAHRATPLSYTRATAVGSARGPIGSPRWVNRSTRKCNLPTQLLREAAKGVNEVAPPEKTRPHIIKRVGHAKDSTSRRIRRRQ